MPAPAGRNRSSNRGLLASCLDAVAWLAAYALAAYVAFTVLGPVAGTVVYTVASCTGVAVWAIRRSR